VPASPPSSMCPTYRCLRLDRYTPHRSTTLESVHLLGRGIPLQYQARALHCSSAGDTYLTCALHIASCKSKPCATCRPCCDRSSCQMSFSTEALVRKCLSPSLSVPKPRLEIDCASSISTSALLIYIPSNVRCRPRTPLCAFFSCHLLLVLRTSACQVAFNAPSTLGDAPQSIITSKKV
jgi:hypothetical protein